MGDPFLWRETQIGTAWMGRHIVIIQCDPTTNQFLSLYHSIGAPVEPAHSTCAETLSRFFSIGYQLMSVTPLSSHQIQYILIRT